MRSYKMELQELILIIPSIGYGKLFREEDKEGNWLAELLRPINVMNVARGKKQTKQTHSSNNVTFSTSIYLVTIGGKTIW